MITIRVTGPDFDISAAIATKEDIEIVEWILAKIRTEIERSAPTQNGGQHG